METEKAHLTWMSAAWKDLLAHCEKEVPREACGALLGTRGQVNAVCPMTNASTGLAHYRIPDAELLAIFDLCDKDKEVEVLGWYHSHPRTSSRPSDADLDLAIPGFYYVIVGIDRVTTFSL